VTAALLREYADPDWLLQRTLADPYEYVPNPQQAERWLYRLVQSRPYTRNLADPATKVELLTWFHYNGWAFMGYVDAKP